MVLVVYKRVKIVPFIYYWYFGRKPQNSFAVQKLKKNSIISLNLWAAGKKFPQIFDLKVEVYFHCQTVSENNVQKFFNAFNVACEIRICYFSFFA